MTVPKPSRTGGGVTVGPMKGNDPVAQLLRLDAPAALGKVQESIGKLQELSVGGGTPDGAKQAMDAAQLLGTTSLLLQHGRGQMLREMTLSPQLDANMMVSATGLASASAVVLSAAKSAEPVSIGEKLKPLLARAGTTVEVALDAYQRHEASRANPSPSGYL